MENSLGAAVVVFLKVSEESPCDDCAFVYTDQVPALVSVAAEYDAAT